MISSLKKNQPKILDKFRASVDEYNMLENVSGVLVGYSGGADSSALLRLMKVECDRLGIFIKAVHINHGIRGAEAQRDADFCSAECRSLGVEFELVCADIPELARRSGKGVEEAARDFRYEQFLRIIESDTRLDTIATAHNADDNAETLLFNLIRGSGIAGLSGIPPVRELGAYRVIRPLIAVSKDEILSFCHDGSIDFVHDSTNDDTAYTRNYIRHELIPGIKRLNPSFLSSAARLSAMARTDEEYIGLGAARLASSPSVAALAAAHPAVASRAISRLYSEVSSSMLENVHIRAILSLCRKGQGELSLPNRVFARIESGMLVFTREAREELSKFEFELKPGSNRFDAQNFAVFLSSSGEAAEDFKKDNETLKKIYKLSMHIRLNSDTINHILLVRSRHDGDSYAFGGMTRRLKKLYNDRGFDEKKRRELPIFCDGDGIVWVPGFPCADRVKPSETAKESIGDGSISLIYYYNEV